MNDSLSLYLHIPFCRHRCAYCDFNTYTGLSDLQSAYARALAQEVSQVADAAAAEELTLPAHTIFFGGGTPSLMAPEDLGKTLHSVRRAFDLASDAEITMEANPGTVDRAYLQEVRALGVNRLSFGMQSANAGELSLLEREHTLETVVDAVRLSRAAGFDNLSLDLIYGLPDQSLQSWERSLRAALALNPEHLSLYCLTIEPGTPMHRWLHNGDIQPPDPDLAAEQYELACRLLEADGWVHYEISNWARPGYQCRHNLTYWRNGEYLGLGAGAHGHAAGARYEVVKQPRVYLRRLRQGQPQPYPLSPAVAQAHHLDAREAMSDTLMMQLRLLQEGVELAAFEQRFGQSVRDAFGESVDQLLEWGLLQEDGERLLLTRRGWFLSNQVFYRLV
ncbi:MAG TPA: radical SAM family heme chaperone HemW [Candidatus Sulfomarinibacteraceae bacterium]|nr:radical SAM family heme chaperone HemW [Candidatus Sulfomarinibacteraceae bacterium]